MPRNRGPLVGVEETLRQLAALAAAGSKEREISELVFRTSVGVANDARWALGSDVGGGSDGSTERMVVEALAQIVRRDHCTWVPDPLVEQRTAIDTWTETSSGASDLLRRTSLDGDELCVLLGALLTAAGIPCRISARKYDGEFVHPVLHWRDRSGAWHLTDPCSTPASEAEHDARMVAELTVPIRGVP
jgi:hypothetical protein